MTKINPSISLLDRLESDLRQEFPKLRIQRTDSSIRVLPDTENGFAVELVDAIQEIVPILGKWVYYGLDQETAIPIFQAGLRGEARLHEISRGEVAYHWSIEVSRNGAWVKEKKDYYSVPFFSWLFLIFGRKRERILWNNPSRLR